MANIIQNTTYNFKQSLFLGSSLLDQMDRVASRSSLDSHEAIREDNNSLLERFRRVASIVRGSLNGLEQAGSIENIDNVDSNEDKPITIVEHQKPSHFNTSTESAPENRLLSRSESAGDANIIDKLQNSSIKTCSKSLLFSEGDTEPEAEENENNSPSK